MCKEELERRIDSLIEELEREKKLRKLAEDTLAKLEALAEVRINLLLKGVNERIGE